MDYTTVAAMQRRFKKLSIEGVIAISLDQEKEAYLDLQREQFAEGEKSTGNPILPLYAASTVKKKIRKGLPYDRVTLYETGKYWGELYASIDTTGLHIGSEAEYAIWIERRYDQGHPLYGLTPGNRLKFRALLEPVFIGNVKKVLHV